MNKFVSAIKTNSKYLGTFLMKSITDTYKI